MEKVATKETDKSVISTGWIVRIAILMVILAAYAVVQVSTINNKVGGDMRGWSVGFYANIGRNLLTLDLAESKGGMIDNTLPKQNGMLRPYVNHPPMAGWISALSIKFLGFRESSLRWPAVLASLCSIVLFSVILSRLIDKWLALAATLVFAFLPMNIHYGVFLDVQGPIVLFFALLMILCYLRFYKKPSNMNLALLLVVFFIGTLADWPIYYLAGILPFHYRFAKKKWSKKLSLLPVAAFLAFGCILLYSNWLLSDEISLDPHRLLAASAHRSGTAIKDTGQSESFTVNIWYEKVIADFLVAHYTLTALLISLGWLVYCIVLVIRKTAGLAHWTFLALVVFGLVHIGLFMQGAFIHPFWSFYLMPAIAIGTVLAIASVSKAVFRNYRIIQITVCIVAIGFIGFLSATSAMELNEDTEGDYHIIGQSILEHVPPNTTILCETDCRVRYGFYLLGLTEPFQIAAVNMQVGSYEKNRVHILVSTHSCNDLPEFIMEYLTKNKRIMARWGSRHIFIYMTKDDMNNLAATLPAAPISTHSTKRTARFVCNGRRPAWMSSDTKYTFGSKEKDILQSQV